MWQGSLENITKDLTECRRRIGREVEHVDRLQAKLERDRALEERLRAEQEREAARDERVAQALERADQAFERKDQSVERKQQTIERIDQAVERKQQSVERRKQSVERISQGAHRVHWEVARTTDEIRRDEKMIGKTLPIFVWLPRPNINTAFISDEFLRSIQAFDLRAVHAEICRVPLPGTGNWLVDSPEFLAWSTSKSLPDNVLWCFGKRES